MHVISTQTSMFFPIDCDSGDDEKSCKLDDEKPVKRTCADDEFQCKDGRCILVREKRKVIHYNKRNKQCSFSMQQKTWTCDGIADCKRHGIIRIFIVLQNFIRKLYHQLIYLFILDDETNCKVTCDVGQFMCPVYKNMTNARICVNQKHICDGQFDCISVK